MIKLKKIKLVNFCGFRDFELDLTEKEGVRQWTVLFGTNGSGKSSVLNAIRLLSSPWQMENRPDLTLFLRRLTYHPDYLSNYLGYIDHRNDMYAEATFLIEEEEKKVIIKNTGKKETTGLIKNELPKDIFSFSFYVDADNPINTQNFQIIQDYREQFLDFAKEVYGFDCIFPDERITTEEYDTQKNEYIRYITDFILVKDDGTKVHYKRFSDGEKKIAKILTTLFNNVYDKKEQSYILLIDSIEKEIYFKRHMKLINKLTEHFPNNQFFIATHSPIIINEMEKKCLIDLEKRNS